MKTFVKYTALGVLSLGLIATSITAASAVEGGKHKRGERPSFEMLDTNSDGFITAEDAEAKRMERFASVDANGDGFLTLEELQAAPMGRGGKMGPGGKAGKGGADHAGKQGADHQPNAEMRADKAARMLRYLDENGDGKVAFDEMPSRDKGRMMARLDTDEDGKISQAEFDAAKEKFGKRKNKGADAQ